MSSACGTCPYRKSTPPGVWHPSEYANLFRQDAEQFGATFGCHLNDGSLCRGWLSDQKRRGVPSISLRLKLIRDKAALAIFEAVDEKDPDLYPSIAAMVRANRGRRFPTGNAKADKLARLKSKRTV